MARQTKAILAAYAEASSDGADAVVAIGRRMRTIRARLDRGNWLDWIEHATPLARRSVYNYIGLADWADAHAKQFARLKHLGPTKLYLLAGVEPAHLATLALKRPIPLPGGASKTPELMTAAELAHVVGGFKARELPVDPPHPPAGPPMAELLSHARTIENRLRAALTPVMERRREIDLAAAKKLRAPLAKLLADFDEAFGI